MNPSTIIPIRPASDSLHSHLSALSALIAQLEALPNQTRWPAYIPLTSRARIHGEIQHLNEVKVNVGDGWWVEMTAGEAAGYLRRRKAALLEEQARSMEGKPAMAISRDTMSEEARTIARDPVALNPLFTGISEPVPSPSKVATSGSHGTTRSIKEAAGAGAAESIREASLSTAGKAAVSSKSEPTSSATATSLEQVLDSFLANEQTLYDASSGRAPDSGLTEDGLPIQEIRETPSGDTIGPMPTVAPGIPAVSEAEVSQEKEDDYWSEAAKARRKALFSKVFGDGSDISDDDGERDQESVDDIATGAGVSGYEDSLRLNATAGPSTSGVARRSSVSRSPPPTLSGSPARSESPEPNAEHVLARRPSASQPLPSRSILKVPPARKKSVSFDESVPVPPDSPRPTKMGFQLPLASSEEAGLGAKIVPVIPEPVPGTKKVLGNGFGGMRRGFLDPPGKKQVEEPEKPVNSGGKRKPSLFAQRMAHQTVKEVSTVEPSPAASTSAVVDPSSSLPPAVGASVKRSNEQSASLLQPGLPKMSETPSTAAIRPSVHENALASSSKRTLHSAVPPTPPTGPSGLSGDQEEEEADDPGFLDDDDDEEDEEDEDEYDLDDALLAREVALEYHRRRAYKSPYISQDPDDPNYGHVPPEGSGDMAHAGGVMLAMPQVQVGGTTGGPPAIINPTPDDFRRYVRVGKLENGNLVLAPGEEGWSSDEDGPPDAGEDGHREGELERERRKKRDNRRNIKDVLLGKRDAAIAIPPPSPPNKVETSAGSKKSLDKESSNADRSGLPPIVRSHADNATISTPATPAVGAVMERASAPAVTASMDPPKKVSRFKAARMG